MATEYRFGSMKIGGEERHTVRVKSNAPAALPIGAYKTVVEESVDMTVRHTFKPSRLIKEQAPDDGHYYAWYVIDEYVKIIDRSPAASAASARNEANIDYVAMMAGIDLPNM